MTDETPPRRTVLAAMGSSLIGGAITTGSATAQDRDPSEYDRPRTVEENGVEITLWDCSRVVVDGPAEIAQIVVYVQYYDFYADYYDSPEPVHGTLNTYSFDMPVDIRVNDHIREFDPVDGSVIIEAVNVYTSVADRIPQNADEDRLVSIRWPQDEWDCFEVIGMVPPPEIIRDPEEIEYDYDYTRG